MPNSRDALPYKTVGPHLYRQVRQGEHMSILDNSNVDYMQEPVMRDSTLDKISNRLKEEAER